MPRLIRLLVILGDGGHTAQMLRLVALLGPDFGYEYVVARSDEISEQKITVPGRVWRLTSPRAKGDSYWRVAWRLARSFVEAAGVVLRCRPDAVVGCGPALMVPVAVLGKALGAKVIFLESGSRVTELSLTGKLMRRLADQFYVQWEPLHARYPETIYAGRLL